MKIINEMTLMRVHGFIEKTYVTAEGYYGVVLFNKGYRSGFVALPANYHKFVEPTAGWLRGMELDYSGTKSNLYKTLELKEHLWFLGFNCHGANDGIDVEMLHKLGVPGFKTKTNGGNVKTLEFVIEKINNLSAQLTPQAIMEHKMRTINNQN